MTPECIPIATLPGTTALFRAYTDPSLAADPAALRRWYPADPFTLAWAATVPHASTKPTAHASPTPSSARPTASTPAAPSSPTSSASSTAPPPSSPASRSPSSVARSSPSSRPPRPSAKPRTPPPHHRPRACPDLLARQRRPRPRRSRPARPPQETPRSKPSPSASTPRSSRRCPSVSSASTAAASPATPAPRRRARPGQPSSSPYAPITDLLRECYAPDATLAGAFGRLLTKIFAAHGLIVLDAASRDFHALGAPILRAAIERSDDLESALLARSSELEAAGYHAQVLVTPGHSLLFLVDDRPP